LAYGGNIAGKNIMPDKLVKILLVEDSESDAALLQEEIMQSDTGDHQIKVAGSLQQAIDYFKNNQVDATLLDLNLPDSSGLDTVRAIMSYQPDAPIVVLTGYDDEKTGIEAVRMGTQDYLVKGKTDGRLISRAVRYAIERKRMEVELRKARDELEIRVEGRTRTIKRQSKFLEAYFQYSLTTVMFLDRNFNFLRVNDEFARACQKRAADFPGHNYFEFFPDPENKAIFENAIRTRTPYVAVAKPFAFLAHPELGTSYFDWTLVPIPAENGAVGLLILSLKDVTERVQAELALREKDQYLRAIVSNAPIILFSTDERGIITVLEGKGLDTLGWKAGELVGSNVFEKLRDYPTIIENVHCALRGESFTAEVELPGGVIFDARYLPVRDERNNIRGVISTSIDITERKRAERRILADQEQLRALTAELLMVEEGERRKIAGELHDSVGQILAFLKIELGDMQRSGLPKESVSTIRHLREQVERAIEQTRSLTFEMSPPELYTLGLGPALEELAQRFSEERGLACSVDAHDDSYPLSDQVKILLYRAVRELLINAAKHARAQSVQIKINKVGDNIEIVIEDNGIGFDTSRLDRTRRIKTPGFGLFSISERLGQMGGKIEINSIKGKGTKITLSAPLEQKVPQERIKEG
jgi:PAS domain S-box-containing protein